MAPIFEIHLEEWNHALHIEGRGHKSPILWLMEILMLKNIVPVIYVLKDWMDENPNKPLHGIIKSHGIHHYYDEKADRSPYFNQEGYPGLCGGFFFRLLPLWVTKMEIKRTGMFFIHPHDLDEKHPKLENPVMDWKRHVGLKTARSKLERLLKEVNWGCPEANQLTKN